MSRHTKEEAEKIGRDAFHRNELLGDGNPMDSHLAEYNWWENGWWKANREVFAEGAADWATFYILSQERGYELKDLNGPYQKDPQKHAVWKEGHDWAKNNEHLW